MILAADAHRAGSVRGAPASSASGIAAHELHRRQHVRLRPRARRAIVEHRRQRRSRFSRAPPRAGRAGSSRATANTGWPANSTGPPRESDRRLDRADVVYARDVGAATTSTTPGAARTASRSSAVTRPCAMRLTPKAACRIFSGSAKIVRVQRLPATCSVARFHGEPASPACADGGVRRVHAIVTAWRRMRLDAGVLFAAKRRSRLPSDVRRYAALARMSSIGVNSLRKRGIGRRQPAAPSNVCRSAPLPRVAHAPGSQPRRRSRCARRATPPFSMRNAKPRTPRRYPGRPLADLVERERSVAAGTGTSTLRRIRRLRAPVFW